MIEFDDVSFTENVDRVVLIVSWGITRKHLKVTRKPIA